MIKLSFTSAKGSKSIFIIQMFIKNNVIITSIAQKRIQSNKPNSAPA